MPQYELMYIIGSHVPDSEIPAVVEEIKKFIADSQGVLEKHEDLGKKKLAYPIKKSRTGHYVLVNFSAPADKIGELEHKIRTTQAIIRHLVLNMDESLVRMEKDQKAQAVLKLLKPKAEAVKKEETRPKAEKKIEIDLDAEIEKALEGENLK